LTFFNHDVSKFIHVPGKLDYILHFRFSSQPNRLLEDSRSRHSKLERWERIIALGLAKAKGARMLVASTSEVYGDPLVHPQTEEYWGNVNPVGPRGVYDEAKRYMESITMAYHTYHKD
jgi:dTDP-glucose 4,6-dehydratase